MKDEDYYTDYFDSFIRNNPVGRPRKDIDRETVQRLCAIQCTLEEIAGFFNCSVDTIQNKVKEWDFKNYSAFYKQYSQEGKISLRRAQYKAALEGNAALLIWLGKQRLGQYEKIKTVNDDPPEVIDESLKSDSGLKEPETN